MTQTSSGLQKPICLVILKYPAAWNQHLLRKLRLVYDVHTLHADEVFRVHGSSELKLVIAGEIAKYKYAVVFFDTDFYPVVDATMIASSACNASARVLLSFDDLIMHVHNSITATACDLVLTADPISVLRYREKGIPAEYIALEGSGELYFDRGLDRDIDVLHFGVSSKADRLDFLTALEQAGIKVSTFGADGTYVSSEELARLIARSKIVINFSKTDFLSGLKIDGGEAFAHPYYYQFKGRVIETGLSGSLCVTEYAPGLELLFPNTRIPTFTTKDECVELVRYYLDHEEVRRKCAMELHEATMKYEDRMQMSRVNEAIQRIRPRPALVNLPQDYLTTVLDARISRLVKRPMVALRELMSFSRSIKEEYPKQRSFTTFKLIWIVLCVLWKRFVR